MPKLGNNSLSEEQIKASRSALFQVYRETRGTDALSEECQKLLQKALDAHAFRAYKHFWTNKDQPVDNKC